MYNHVALESVTFLIDLAKGIHCHYLALNQKKKKKKGD